MFEKKESGKGGLKVSFGIYEGHHTHYCRDNQQNVSDSYLNKIIVRGTS